MWSSVRNWMWTISPPCLVTALANASLELLADREAWHAAQAAGIKRVERYYTQDLMFGEYRALYVKALGAPDARGGT